MCVSIFTSQLTCHFSLPSHDPSVKADRATLGRVYDNSKKVLLTAKSYQTLLMLMLASRYSEFDDLREKLLITFPNAVAAMPPLPPKSVFCEWLAPEVIPCTQLTPMKTSSDLNFLRREGLGCPTSSSEPEPAPLEFASDVYTVVSY